MGEFLCSFNEGSKKMRNLLGGKGANLSEMTGMGLPVPFGFVITTKACGRFFAGGRALDAQIIEEMRTKIREVEEVTGKEFGGGENPLLVSVRISNVIKIPTMTGTVFNLGLNDKTVQGLANLSDMEFALDCYTRFLRTYGWLVRRIPQSHFIAAYEIIKKKALDKDGEDYSEEAVLFDTAMQYKSIIMKKTGHPVPDEPFDQLREAVSAALGHWNSYATRSYRELHEIPESVGTAVVVQAMVFGNMDQNSCTGTVFTRDPNTGEKITCGEFLMKSQGGDTSFRDIEAVKIEKMEDFFPQLYRKFFDIAQLLERYNENVQEIEFTVESGKLYMLETKAARRTPAASVKIAVDMVSEGIVDRETSVANIRASDINKLVLKQFKDQDSIDVKTVDNFNTILEWADEFRTVGVRANIDTPEDAALAIKLGAEGVGLCRSEHMFFGEDRIYDFIRMIIAEDAAERNRAIAALKPYQKDDFKRIFRIMEDRPVTIRLLDPSFHRFLPHAESDIRNLAGKLKISEKKLGAKVLLLREENPAMGKRGSRLAVLHPEIVRMQTEAVIEAALEVRGEVDGDLNISIMVPFISSVREFTNVRETVETTAMQCLKAADASLDFSVGTMIETPRAALLADMIAEKADFFSFGTNDLTELVYGLSKEDTEDLIEEYIKKDILDKNPFYSLDERGVGRMIEMACISGRKTKPKLKIGICGEHGGDPDTIEFCESIGINYFSCSTLRIPGARLAAAQAEINSAKKIERVR